MLSKGTIDQGTSQFNVLAALIKYAARLEKEWHAHASGISQYLRIKSKLNQSYSQQSRMLLFCLFLNLSVRQHSLTESSNACTAISLLTSCSIYYNTFPDISQNNLKDIQDNYVSLIMKGNAIYDIIEPPLQQPNLEIDEVLDKMEMPVKIGQGGFRGIYDLPQLKTEFSQMFADKDEMCAIMITPPDKSFALHKTNRNLILFESHRHCDRGAIIAFTDDDNVADFCNYINTIMVNDWKSTVQYSNLTPICRS